MAEKYLEVPKHKFQGLRGFKANEGFTHHNSLPLLYAISQSLILSSVPRVHEQHMEVHRDGACCPTLITRHLDEEVRSLSEIACPSPLLNCC